MTSRIHRFRELTVTHTAYEAWLGRQSPRAAFSKIQTAPGTYDMMRCFRRAAFCILRAARLLRRTATFSEGGIMPSEGVVLFAEGGRVLSQGVMLHLEGGIMPSECSIQPYDIMLSEGGILHSKGDTTSPEDGNTQRAASYLRRAACCPQRSAEYLLRASCCIWRAASCLQRAAFNLLMST